MKLKLKENPKEWLKFTAVMAVLAVLVSALLYRRRLIGVEALSGIVVVVVLVLCVYAIRPRWFRGFYRVGMTASFRVGQALGWVWLTLLFLLVLTPLGLLLRAFGKDLLEMKRRKTDTYWRTARPPGGFDRQF
jgi:hypothetical protein